MRHSSIPLALALALAAPLAGCLEDEPPPPKVADPKKVVDWDRNGWMIRGKYTLLLSGTFDTYRVPPAEWERRLLQMKGAGLNTVDLYVAWNVHEPEPGKFDFSSPRADLDRFLSLCEEHGLYVYFRPGPYICNETDGGGLPAWLFTSTSDEASASPDGKIRIREADADFLAAVRRYFSRLNQIVRRHELRGSGGSIVLYAVANEHDWYAIFRQIHHLGLPPDVPAYLSALRDMVRAEGITVPITTATGDGVTWQGTGDVDLVIPCPNLYDVRPASSIEGRVHESLADMHDRGRHSGRYVDFPSLVSETERTATRIARVLYGGMDGVSLFNFNGFPVEGYENGFTLDFSLGGGLTPQNLLSTITDPRFGYFPGQIDYRSPISARGSLREEYYRIRRVAHHFQAISDAIAPAYRAERTGPRRTSNALSVSNPDLGAWEGSGRAVYWLASGGTTAFGLLNQTGRVQETKVTVDGETWPRFSRLSVATGAGRPGALEHETWVENLLVHRLPLGAGLPELRYSTSEVFTRFADGARTVLVLSGDPGTDGELALAGVPAGARIRLDDLAGSASRREGDRWTWTYRHEPDRFLVLDLAGRELAVLVTTTPEAERLWRVVDAAGRTWLVSDAAWVAGVSVQGAQVRFDAEWDEGLDGKVLVLGPFAPASVARDGAALTGRRILEARAFLGDGRLAPTYPEPPVLSSGRQVLERLAPGESETSFADGTWRATASGPEKLEALGITKGHAWYRTTFDLAAAPSGPAWLEVEEAAGIVSVYANGRYVGTRLPMGRPSFASHALEIEIPAAALRSGRNVLAFRVQIWGHSNFEIPPVPVVLDFPALQVAYPRGLWGRARVIDSAGAWRADLVRPWRYESRLLGERDLWAGPAEPPGARAAPLPLSVAPGETVWYRATFDGSSLPGPRYVAPLVLALAGEGLVGTIHVNGRLVGRWISDDRILDDPSPGRGIRDQWVPEGLSADHFYVPRSILHETGPNVVAIALESLSRKSVFTGITLEHATDGFDKTRDGGRIRAVRMALEVGH